MKGSDALQEIKKRLIEESNNCEFFYPNTKDSFNENTYIWVGARTGLIGTEYCHYEFYMEDKESLSIDFHFAESNTNKEYQAIIDKLPSFLDTKNDWPKYDGGFRRVVYKDTLKFSEFSVEEAFKRLKKLDDAIGKKIEKIVRLHEEFQPNNIRKKKVGKPGSTVKEKTNTSRVFNEATYKSKHSPIQEKLKKQLEESKKYKTVDYELPLGDIRVDVYGVKNYRNKEVYDLYEVKPYDSPTDCIREALGQILLYKYNFERSGYKVDKLVIVGPNRLLEYDFQYLKYIKTACPDIKIEYISI